MHALGRKKHQGCTVWNPLRDATEGSLHRTIWISPLLIGRQRLSLLRSQSRDLAFETVPSRSSIWPGGDRFELCGERKMAEMMKHHAKKWVENNASCGQGMWQRWARLTRPRPKAELRPALPTSTQEDMLERIKFLLLSLILSLSTLRLVSFHHHIWARRGIRNDPSAHGTKVTLMWVNLWRPSLSSRRRSWSPRSRLHLTPTK